MRDKGQGVRDIGQGVRDKGQGVRDIGQGVRDTGQGVRDIGWMDGWMEPFILIRHFIKLKYTAILKFGLHKIRKENITI